MVNVFNATDLYTLRRLTWQILCYVYSTTTTTITTVIVNSCFSMYIPWRPSKGFPDGASGKDPACQCRRHKRCGFDPWAGKVSGRRTCNPLQYSCPGESPWTAEPGSLQSMGSQRDVHDRSDLAHDQATLLWDPKGRTTLAYSVWLCSP